MLRLLLDAAVDDVAGVLVLVEDNADLLVVVRVLRLLLDAVVDDVTGVLVEDGADSLVVSVVDADFLPAVDVVGA